MEILHDEADTLEVTDQLLIDFVIVQIDHLNKVLLENGIADKEVRRKICYGFFYYFSYFIDAGWIKKNDKKFFPLVCLAERKEVGEEYKGTGFLGEIELLHVPTDATSQNEYYGGNIDYYFDDIHENVSEIKIGSYSDED